jgi:serine/threonine protein kinase
MDIADAGSLRSYLPLSSDTGRVGIKILVADEKLSIALGIIDGMIHLHKSRIVHRDLKPENILLATVKGELVPKICDFGLSRVSSTMLILPICVVALFVYRKSKSQSRI